MTKEGQQETVREMVGNGGLTRDTAILTDSEELTEFLAKKSGRASFVQ